MASQVAKVTRSVRKGEIRQAIVVYKGDAETRARFARIAASEHSLGALADMDLKDIQLNWLLADLARALQIKKQFKLILDEEENFLDRAPRLRKSVAHLSSFVKEVALQPQDGIRARVTLGDENRRRYQQALYEIECLIENRERIARETPTRIGASRKNSHQNAGENAAIGWVAASVLSIKCRPMLRQTALLAETLLGLPEVTEDRARRALRNVSEREWRTSFGSSKPAKKRPIR